MAEVHRTTTMRRRDRVGAPALTQQSRAEVRLRPGARGTSKASTSAWAIMTALSIALCSIWFVPAEALQPRPGRSRAMSRMPRRKLSAA